MQISRIVYILSASVTERSSYCMVGTSWSSETFLLFFLSKKEKWNTPTWLEEERDGAQMCMYEESQH